VVTSDGSVFSFRSKFDADGALLWTVPGASASRFAVSRDGASTYGLLIVTDAGGATPDTIVTRYDGPGDALWTRRFGPFMSGAIAVDPTNTVLYVGTEDTGIGDARVIRVSASDGTSK
jgi:hypothetical protein